MDAKKKVGLSRREMEWLVQGMMHRVPGDPTAMVKHVLDAVMTLIEKNNAAIEKRLSERAHDEEQG